MILIYSRQCCFVVVLFELYVLNTKIHVFIFQYKIQNGFVIYFKYKILCIYFKYVFKILVFQILYNTKCI